MSERPFSPTPLVRRKLRQERLADRTLFLWNGEVVELDRNEVIFGEQPRDRRTYEYVRGVFG